MKTLLLLSPGYTRAPRDERYRREAADEWPRGTFFDDAVATDIIDGPYLRSLTGVRSWLYRPLPAPLVQALEAYRLRHQYDVVVSWDDRLPMLFGLLLTVARSRAHYVAIVTWQMEPRTKRILLRLVQKHIDQIVVWSEIHRELLVEFGGIARSRLTYLPCPVDHQFWRPIETPTDMICAVGNSKRDYATLIQAMRRLPIACRVVTNVNAVMRDVQDWNISRGSLVADDIPDHVTIGTASPAELRAVYARSRCVVIPLGPGFKDNGVTVATEAMAMAKPIICSRTYGMVDVVEDGVTGILVPPGDPQALSEAIQYLWDHPEVAERMGAEGRRRAETLFALERFTAGVKQVVEDSVRSLPQGGTNESRWNRR